jgi:hypothetical protein
MTLNRKSGEGSGGAGQDRGRVADRARCRQIASGLHSDLHY